MAARTLMVQGTASSVGKSVLVAALCRIFRNDGLRVAPFKSQNMALNSFVTPDGGEIGRAQAVQAEAAGVDPAVEMNPVLLKPEGEMRSQVIVLGRPVGSMSYREYESLKPGLREVVARSLARLREKYDLVIIEGAGSPAEINLRHSDIANMYVAGLAVAPVILVGDIDRGGVFAQFVGTMELLEAAERERVRAFVINRFRGDSALLEPGLEFLAARFGIPVLGVVPYLERLRIPEEDSVALEERRERRRPSSAARLDIAVVRLPSISNYDDFLALEHDPRAVVRFVETAKEAAAADLVILPGSKSTVADLDWLRRNGIADEIVGRGLREEPVLGICGGCQMLGEVIDDPDSVESPRPSTPGLGLLALRTRFARTKLTAQVIARAEGDSFLTRGVDATALGAYEIHMGRIERAPAERAPFRVLARGGRAHDEPDGAVSENGAVVGTMLHGILENEAVQTALVRNLLAKKGFAADPAPQAVPTRDEAYERLAAAVRESLDMAQLRRIAGLD